MQPHIADDCSLSLEDNEVSCDNLPRLRSPRLMDDGETLEYTCQTQAHEVDISELDDRVLETVTRRLCERDKEHKHSERERLLNELRSRALDVPSEPTDTTWHVIELPERRVRTLEAGAYPEAYQMAQLAANETVDEETWSRTDDDTLKVMLVSEWGMKYIPDDLQERSVPLAESRYDRDYF